MDLAKYQEDGAIHEFFSLSYANYLILARSVLQSMPLEWQERFVNCIKEISNALPEEYNLPINTGYFVQLRHNGKFMSIKNDPLNGYERGRRRINLNIKEV
jgi:hypothetical protein